MVADGTHLTQLGRYARAFRRQLVEQALPRWRDSLPDRRRGGYVVPEVSGNWKQPWLGWLDRATSKHAVHHARVVWVFSHAVVRQLVDDTTSYLDAARTGYDFLLEHFLDPDEGGYYWRTDRAGRARNDAKLLCAQSFVIFGLVEYHRASGDADALGQARRLYQAVDEHLRDREYGGWIEHAAPDWSPLPPEDRRVAHGIGGSKSGDVLMHWMEALTELLDVTGDPAVRESLHEAVTLNQEYFFPLEPGRAAPFRKRDWTEIGEHADEVNYGHSAEFAWLMVRAEQVLGVEPSWDHFERILDHTLRFGFDHERGGVYRLGFGNQLATDTSKLWWVQAEMLAALADASTCRSEPRYVVALEQLARFIDAYVIDPADGIWIESVDAGGHPAEGSRKAHNWKEGYHEVRAVVKFADAFAERLRQ